MGFSAGRSRVRALALVGAGGFSGAIARWVLATWLPAGIVGWSGLPLGTLAANVLASLLLGFLLSEATLGARFSPETRLLVGTGFCGSLSTYSTFAAETTSLSAALAGGYVVVTYALGFTAVVAGTLVGRWVS